jgi:hypothetical protein
MMYGRRRRTLGALGAAAMFPACVASPSASAERDTDAAPVGGQGGAQPLHDSSPIGGTQPVADAELTRDVLPALDIGLMGGTQPDAGPHCAPAALATACITAQGEALRFEFQLVVVGEVTAMGTAAPENCDFVVWGGSAGEAVTFQVTEASGRILDVQIDAGGLDAYLAAHPLSVGEPVQLDLAHLVRNGMTSGLRWLRDGELVVAALNGAPPLTGLTVTRLAEVGEPSGGGGCLLHQFGARIAVDGTGVEVDVAPGCAVEAEGLTISNVSYDVYEDLGCCNAFSGPYVTVVARP